MNILCKFFGHILTATTKDHTGECVCRRCGMRLPSAIMYSKKKDWPPKLETR